MSKGIPQNTQVGYIAEVTDGTTPATPAFQVFRATGESLEVSRKLVFSSELNGARGQKNFAVAAEFGQGAFEFEFTDGTLEDFLAGAMRGAWSTDVLVDANTAAPFTVETKFELGATDVYKRLKGAQVDTMSLNLRPGEPVTGSVGFKARIANYINSIFTGATYVAGNTEALVVGAKIGALAMSGLTFDQIASLTWNLNNNLSFQEALGSLNPVGIAPGSLEISGQLSLFVDSTMYNILSAAQDGVATSLVFKVNSGVTGKATNFSMPNVVLSDIKAEAGAANGPSVMATMNWRALQSASISQSVAQITRNTT